MSEKKQTRRNFLSHFAALSGIAAGSGLLWSACQTGVPETPAGAAATGCNDVSGLTDAERQMRTQLQYAETTPDPAKDCTNCQLWIAQEAGAACGGCQLLKGPIAPKGYCISWAARQV